MPEPKKEEIAPLFEAYGAACYEAQHLEGSLRLLLLLVNEHKKNNPNPKTVRDIDTEDSQKTLGDLFKAAQKKEYFTSAERNKINKAIKERNFLIHSYWSKRIEYAATPKGRAWLIQNLNELRELMRASTSIINSLIDHYLEQYGVNVEYFTEKTTEVWESDTEPPPDILH